MDFMSLILRIQLLVQLLVVQLLVVQLPCNILRSKGNMAARLKTVQVDLVHVEKEDEDDTTNSADLTPFLPESASGVKGK